MEWSGFHSLTTNFKADSMRSEIYNTAYESRFFWNPCENWEVNFGHNGLTLLL